MCNACPCVLVSFYPPNIIECGAALLRVARRKVSTFGAFFFSIFGQIDVMEIHRCRMSVSVRINYHNIVSSACVLRVDDHKIQFGAARAQACPSESVTANYESAGTFLNIRILLLLLCSNARYYDMFMCTRFSYRGGENNERFAQRTYRNRT